MTKVRFHLGAGEHFQHWQVTRADGRVEYFDPEQWDLFMVDCKLKNRRKTAEKIFAGENKTVCAWVNCEQAIALPRGERTAAGKRLPVMYNPRIAPHWRDMAGQDLDNLRYVQLTTHGRNLFCQA